MVNVSKEWEAAQKETLLPEMFVEISYEVTEPGLQEDAVASGNNEESFSNVAQIVDGLEKHSEAYSALDFGCWGLDGSFEYFDDDVTDPGYVNASFSDENGNVSDNQYPTITIDFEERRVNLIPGMVITWSETFGAWATDFRITISNAQGIVGSTTVTGNTSPVSHVDFDMIEYSKITIEVLKWSHPHQRVRCADIMLGVRTIYTKDDLLGYTHSQSVDLLSAVLPENKIDFSLRNEDGRWNPDSPTGTEKYLLERQEVKVRYGMDIDGEVEWIKGGTFWLSEWNTPQNGMEATFTARDATEFMRAVYRGIRSGTLYDIAEAAFHEMELAVAHVVDESLKYITTDFSADESEYMISDVLQMIAHAGCCVFYQDRDGVVRIEPRNTKFANYTIDSDISYTHPEYSVNKPLKAISVEYGADRQSEIIDVGARGEVQTIQNQMLLTVEDARRVGKVAADLLQNRKVISGDFRADLRMDALDNIVVASKYASNLVGITDITYSTTGGGFNGKYTGRVVTIDLHQISHYSGETYSGEM